MMQESRQNRILTLLSNPPIITGIGWAALVLYACLGMALIPLHPMGVDDENFSHWTSTNFAYGSSPIDLSVISPFQGLGGLAQPLGVWLNPGHLVTHLFPARDPRKLSFIVMMLALAISTFLLARALGLPCHLALFSAQILPIVCFPPAVYRIGSPMHLNMTILYVDCSPPIAFVTALGTLLLAIFCYLGRLSTVKNAVCAALVPLLVVYAVLCDPLYTAMFFVPIAIFMTGTFVSSGNRKVFLWRAGASIICLLVCLSINLPGFYRALAGYAARATFPNELYVEIQRWDYITSLATQGGLTTLAALLVMVSCVVLWALGPAWTRGLALSMFGFQIVMAVMSVVYVYSGIRWSAPLPQYFEYSALPSYVVVSVLGLWIGYKEGIMRFPGAASRLVRFLAGPKGPQVRLMFVYACVLALPAAGMIGIAGKVAFFHREAPSAAENRLGPQSIVGAIVRTLEGEIALRKDGLFRGSVAIVAGVPGGGIADQQGIRKDAPYVKENLNHTQEYLRTYDPNLFTTGLWNLRIPTLEDNNHLVTPAFHFLMSRTLSRPQDFHSRNWEVLTNANPKLMAALGARFLLTDLLQADPLLTLRTRQTNQDGVTLYLYEILHANLADYSPIQTVTSTDASETIALMTGSGFSFQDTAVLSEGTLAPLTRAEFGAMSFERGGVRIRGESRALSLLVLPIQFSNSLRITSTGANSKGAPIRLIRVNLLETGVLFDGEIEVKISHIFGPFRDISGRQRDIADFRRLGIRETGEIPYPPDYQPLAGKWFRVR